MLCVLFHSNKKIMTQKKEKYYEKMPVLNLQAAGIDVGSREHYVAATQSESHFS